MRAVNLLPSDLRGVAPTPARIVRPEPAPGIGAYVVLGALALCVAALAGYVLLGNGVKQRQSDLVVAQQRATTAASKAAALKPYADFAALAGARVETVRGLAASRFDWEQALRDISHAVPGDVKLQSLNGDMGLPGASGTGGDPLRGSIAAPAITMVGCTTGHDEVARLLARLRGVEGVTRVALSKSEAATSTPGAVGDAGASESPCRATHAATFSVVVFFERAAAIAALAPAAASANTTVPVPNAVNGTPDAPAADGAPATDGTAAPSTATGEPQAAATDSAGAPTTTSTTPGSTP